MEKNMKKNMENVMETLGPFQFKRFYREHVKENGSYYLGLRWLSRSPRHCQNSLYSGKLWGSGIPKHFLYIPV